MITYHVYCDRSFVDWSINCSDQRTIKSRAGEEGPHESETYILEVWVAVFVCLVSHLAKANSLFIHQLHKFRFLVCHQKENQLQLPHVKNSRDSMIHVTWVEWWYVTVCIVTVTCLWNTVRFVFWKRKSREVWLIVSVSIIFGGVFRKNFEGEKSRK